MSEDGRIISVNISTQKGTVKSPVAEALLGDRGIVGDAHAGPWHRQVSMLGQESIDSFVAETGRQICPGDFAENLTIEGIDLREVAFLDRFLVGPTELELTQIGKKCHGSNCAIFQEVGKCVMPAEGVFCRVIRGGKILPGLPVKHVPKTLDVLIITLSDRAFAGEYEDLSGPRAKDIIEEFLAPKRWRHRIRTDLLSDDPEPLRTRLMEEVREEADIIFTLGGTGVGPRDSAPEIVSAISQKMIPGIMECIRAKFGVDKPAARLSRSVAGIAEKTQIYALPGSVRAVEEYLGEILKTLEHTIFMLHGVDIH